MSASGKELASPLGPEPAWPRFFRRMTSGTVLGLAGGEALGGSSGPWLNMRLFTLSPAGLLPGPSLG